MDEWVTQACDALDIEDDVDVDLILGIARDVAHGVERRAAPLTTYLMGVAVGRAGGGTTAEADVAEKLRALLKRGPATA